MDFNQTVLWQKLKFLLAHDAISDFILEPKERITYKLRGSVIRTSELVPEEDWAMFKAAILLSASKSEIKGHVDGSIALGDFRFRVSLFTHRMGERAILRSLSTTIPKSHELNVPIKLKEKVLTLKQGLILITGPTGSGKSSTIASLLYERAMLRPEHILTLEDPIEFVYPPETAAVFTQREVGVHEPNFDDGLHAALRQAPDVIMVGEIRTPEAAEIALQAAETGHLVISSFHTGSIVQTIQRYLQLIPESRLNFATAVLAETLEAVVVQRLIPIQNNTKRLALHELMIKNVSSSNSIRTSNWMGLQSEIEYGSDRGQLTFGKSLEMARSKALVTKDEFEQLRPQFAKT